MFAPPYKAILFVPLVLRKLAICMFNFKMDNVRESCKFQARKKENKFTLVFDENARREFLNGFHKRKILRKAKAAEKLEKRLKIEKKKIKAGTRVAYQNLLHSHAMVPKCEDTHTQEIDMGLHSVTVTEIPPSALAKENNWIGTNQVHYEDKSDRLVENADDTICKDIEGMEVHPCSKVKYNKKEIELKTPKDLKRAIKREATHHIKKSKVFRMQSKMCQIRNAKKKSRENRRKNTNKKKNRN